MTRDEGRGEKKRLDGSAIVAALLTGLIGGVFTLLAAVITIRAAPQSTAVQFLVGPQPTTTVTRTVSVPERAAATPPTPEASSSTSPPATSLTDLDPTENTYVRTDAVDVNGTTYPQAIWMPFGGCQKTQTLSYDLGRDWSTLTGTVGLNDGSDDQSVVDFTAVLDGKEIYTSGPTGLGSSHNLDVSVVDGLRLQLKIVFVKGDLGACSHPGYAIWGSPTLSR